MASFHKVIMLLKEICCKYLQCFQWDLDDRDRMRFCNRMCSFDCFFHWKQCNLAADFELKKLYKNLCWSEYQQFLIDWKTKTVDYFLKWNKMLKNCLLHGYEIVEILYILLLLWSKMLKMLSFYFYLKMLKCWKMLILKFNFFLKYINISFNRQL